MALKKRMELSSGVDVEYWRIAYVSMDFVAQTGRVVVFGYRNLAARNNGRQPIHDATRTLDVFVGEDTRLSAIYKMLKAQRTEVEPAKEETSPVTGEKRVKPAVVEDGFFYEADDI